MIFFYWKWGIIKKYHDIWNIVSNSMKKEFDSESIYNKKILKTKIKSNGDEATDFHDKEIPKKGSNNTFLSIDIDWFYSSKRWKLLSASIFERIKIHWKRKKVD